jgi:NADH-quinone oxidoreductase subunit M
MMTLFLIFFPLFVAIVLFALRPSNAKVWALAGSLVELCGSLVVAAGFVPTELYQFVVDIPWITSIGLRFAVGVDGIGLVLVLLTTVLVPLIILSSFNSSYHNQSTFY